MSDPNPAAGQPHTTPPANEAIAAGEPPGAAPPAGAITAVPPKAPPPAPPKPPVKDGGSRRFFLLTSWFATAWIAFAGTMTAMALGTLRFLFPNVLAEPPSTFRAGDMNNYEEGKVEDKFKEVGAWVIKGRNEKNELIIYALSTICTHLGCNPNWLPSDRKFKCPCHGSGFQISGINFEGPAPRPLERFAIRKDGDQIIVDKSRKFQYELGQWKDPDSFIPVG
jgi:cytochrome b6-f complex iron-sulfur subunit